MKINSNIQAMIANNVLKSNESKYSASTERLSSGYKINHAEDSPAGMAITNRMNAQIKSLNKAHQNASNAISVVQTAEGALSEMQSMVQRISELSVKASTGTLTENDRNAIQTEVKQLMDEINRISEDTEYNTQNLLGGEQALKGYTDSAKVDVINYDTDFPKGDDYKVKYSKNSSGEVEVELVAGFPAGSKAECVNGVTTITAKDGTKLMLGYDENDLPSGNVSLELRGIGGMSIQIGSSTGQEMKIVIPKMSTKNMGMEGLDCSTEDGAKAAMEMAANALSFVSSVRSSLGAYQNRLESTVSSLDVSIENLNEAYSTIKDVDMADEMVEYTTLQVLVQAGTSMLTQANEQPQSALQLLQ